MKFSKPWIRTNTKWMGQSITMSSILFYFACWFFIYIGGCWYTGCLLNKSKQGATWVTTFVLVSLRPTCLSWSSWCKIFTANRCWSEAIDKFCLKSFFAACMVKETGKKKCNFFMHFTYWSRNSIYVLCQQLVLPIGVVVPEHRPVTHIPQFQWGTSWYAFAFSNQKSEYFLCFLISESISFLDDQEIHPGPTFWTNCSLWNLGIMGLPSVLLHLNCGV